MRADRPVSLLGIGSTADFGRCDVPLVEIFTAEEQRSRTSQAYVRSAVGTRLRYVEHAERTTETTEELVVVQRDELSGLVVRTSVVRPLAGTSVRVQSVIENSTERPIVLTTASTATFGFGASEDDLERFTLAFAESEWLAENRWLEVPLRRKLPRLDLALHGQDGRGHFGYGSHGGWSTGEHLPAGILVDTSSAAAIGWQLETSGAWHCDLAQTLDGGVVSLLGPTDLDHHFAHELRPGASFTTIPVAIAVSPHGRDGVIAELTAHRRWLRRAGDDLLELPLIYNDFMNTMMGQPSTPALLPLIDAAADAGAEIFCIDAGWFAEPSIGDWWSTVGEWTEAPGRFSGGLRELVERIHTRGMRSGLWLEPEVVGAGSPAARALPEDAFFHRFGHRVREHDRFHLDFRHPAARAHLDGVVDDLVNDLGISYLKLDYNINPGAGTEWLAASAGDGLLGHARAFQAWLASVQQRHDGLLIENCASGAMRADYSLLDRTHLQSTSDQQDFRLYPPIAAAAPATILPEQCGNWAYPAVDMSDEETAFTLVTGLSGRLYLSGFLHELRPGQQALLRDAVRVHRRIRGLLAGSLPFWPLGFPAWDDDVVCVGFRHGTGDGATLVVWDRRDVPSTIEVRGIAGRVSEIFPSTLSPWKITAFDDGVRFDTVPGLTARVFSVDGALGAALPNRA